jgi:hypothetical protein
LVPGSGKKLILDLGVKTAPDPRSGSATLKFLLTVLLTNDKRIFSYGNLESDAYSDWSVRILLTCRWTRLLNTIIGTD